MGFFRKNSTVAFAVLLILITVGCSKAESTLIAEDITAASIQTAMDASPSTIAPLTTSNTSAQNVRSITITIQDGEKQQTLATATDPMQTVADLLQEANITLFTTDDTAPSLATPLEDGMVIQILRSFPITIQVDGRIIQTRTRRTNALDVLIEAGIGLVGFDYAKPNQDTLLHENDAIEVIRVTEDFRLNDTPISYQTLWQATDELDLDIQAVISYGQAGILRERVRIRYENGVEVSATADGEWVAQEAVNEVIGYGTRINIGTINTEEGVREYWRIVRMRVTSYTAASSGKSPGDPGYGITASGLPAGTGIVAIDRNIVPFRSSVFVPGYGIGFAGDTGGGVRGRWIDLGYDEDKYASWSGYVDVYYLTPVPNAADINYILPNGLP